MVISIISENFFCNPKNYLCDENALFTLAKGRGVQRNDFLILLKKFPFLENYLGEFFGILPEYNFCHEEFKNPKERFDTPLSYQILKITNILTYLLFVHGNEYEKVLISIFGENLYLDPKIDCINFWDLKRKELEKAPRLELKRASC